MKKILVVICLLIAGSIVSAQPVEVYPSNWWVGMKQTKLQVMLHAPGIGSTTGFSTSYPGVTISSLTRVANKNYLFINLTVAPSAKPGTIALRPAGAGQAIQLPLLARRSGKGTRFAQGVKAADFIYFLMPDRFSNGDERNDRIPGMRDQSLDRSQIFLRHGGDMQGVLNHLDYLQGLGVTALWMTPVIENDMPNRTEHGYAFTNHYHIDPRLGGETAYSKLSDELHRRGMKLIQDAVYNHVGLYNFFVQDMPDSSWLHQWPVFTPPNYKEQVFFDPHAALADRRKMADGWFTREMPDLNQGNPLVATFLIQHAIWCVEKFGVDAWRIDTYKYVDPDFMNACNQALLDEYPRITMFGENWDEGVVNQAYFTRNIFNAPFKSNLTGSLDFEFLFRGIQPALTQAPGGVNQLYETVSEDFLYQEPMNNVIFLDNHDMTRFLSQAGGDLNKLKMGLAWLFTARGIPQLYYGTEIATPGIANPDGNVRLDFPGGWPGDTKNAFTGDGLSADEKGIQDYTRRFAAFRKTASAITSGKLMQFIPENGVYVYFRYDAGQTVMCVMNTNNSSATIDLSRFAERIKNNTRALDVATNTLFTLEKTLTVGPEYLLVMDLKP